MEFMIGFALGLVIAGVLVALHRLVLNAPENGSEPAEEGLEQEPAEPQPTPRRHRRIRVGGDHPDVTRLFPLGEE